MSIRNLARTASTAPFRRAVNDIFESMERDMLAPWGLANQFPSAGGTSAVPSGSSNALGHARTPDINLDFHETNTGFELTADLPGMKKEDITVDVDSESGVLTVSGERKHEREEKSDGDDGKRKYHFVERSFGKSTRSVRLPETADAAKATAGYSSGVLTVAFPKREAPATRRLQVPVVDGDGKASIETFEAPVLQSNSDGK